MKDLKSLFIKVGFSEVKTYLHSGNVVFSLEEKIETLIIEKKIEDLIEKHYNFQVSIFVKEKEDYCQIINKNPFLNKSNFDKSKTYLSLLKSNVEESKILELNKLKKENDKIALGENCLYIKFDTKISDSKLNNNSIERTLKTVATTRNWNTSTKIVDLL